MSSLTHWVDIGVCDVGQKPKFRGRIGVVLWEFHLSLQWDTASSTQCNKTYTQTHMYLQCSFIQITVRMTRVLMTTKLQQSSPDWQDRVHSHVLSVQHIELELYVHHIRELTALAWQQT